jgi:spermidine/putrescine transport system substrate-binding protein
MLIPNKAQHQKNAEKVINYYYDPKVAAELVAYINYVCPVAGAQAEMEKINPDLVDNQLIFPDEQTLQQTHIFRGLTEAEERDYEDQFQKVIGA